MDNKSMAVEIGQRCRRFRNALGISQHKLADMVGTTPQNISKYEKEGIHDIDIIRYLSSALGYDLMTDEVDEGFLERTTVDISGFDGVKGVEFTL